MERYLELSVSPHVLTLGIHTMFHPCSLWHNSEIYCELLANSKENSLFCLEKKGQRLLSGNTEGPLTTRPLNALPMPFPALGEGFASRRTVQLLRQHKSITVQCLRRPVPAGAELNDTVSSAELAAQDLHG